MPWKAEILMHSIRDCRKTCGFATIPLFLDCGTEISQQLYANQQMILFSANTSLLKFLFYNIRA